MATTDPAMHDRKLPLNDPIAAARTSAKDASASDGYRMFVRDLVVPWNIGVYAHEKADFQPVRINLDMLVDELCDPQADDYRAVVCYEDIVTAVTRLAEAGHVNLVETLAERIAEQCLADPRVRRVTVRVEKPDAIAGAASVGVEIARARTGTPGPSEVPPVRVVKPDGT